LSQWLINFNKILQDFKTTQIKLHSFEVKGDIFSHFGDSGFEEDAFFRSISQLKEENDFVSWSFDRSKFLINF